MKTRCNWSTEPTLRTAAHVKGCNHAQRLAAAGIDTYLLTDFPHIHSLLFSALLGTQKNDFNRPRLYL